MVALYNTKTKKFGRPLGDVIVEKDLPACQEPGVTLELMRGIMNPGIDWTNWDYVPVSVELVNENNNDAASCSAIVQ